MAGDTYNLKSIWRTVAEFVPERWAFVCRERFQNVLSAEGQVTYWTSHDDYHLLRAVYQYGTRRNDVLRRFKTVTNNWTRAQHEQILIQFGKIPKDKLDIPKKMVESISQRFMQLAILEQIVLNSFRISACLQFSLLIGGITSSLSSASGPHSRFTVFLHHFGYRMCNSQKNTDVLSEKTSGATGTMKELGVEQKPIKNNSKDASTPEKKADPQNTENEPNLENAMRGTKTAAEDEEAKNLKDKNREEMAALVAAGAALLVPVSKEHKEQPRGTEKTDATGKVKKYEGELEINPLQLTWEQKEMTQKLIVSNKAAAQIYMVKLKRSDNNIFKIRMYFRKKLVELREQ
ncbi:unnamed protein product, partial [Mesorhabditis belari]|uniref:Uncharacterized protein n=1 Tax=Mesorhabditis belari TaxID=2138241 RepID=A0AAF3EKZ0_9BILA